MFHNLLLAAYISKKKIVPLSITSKSEERKLNLLNIVILTCKFYEKIILEVKSKRAIAFLTKISM